MSWVVVALIAYFLLAVANIGDKLFLGNFVPNYKTYTVLVGVLGLVVFIIAPWFMSWVGVTLAFVALFSGAIFIVSLLTFFYSLQVGEASRVVPFIGGLVPVFSLLFSMVFLDDVFSKTQLIAFVLLVVGSVLIVRLPHKTHWYDVLWERVRPRSRGRELLIAVFSALFFALSFVSSKYVYQETGFWNGFLWIRLGGLIPITVLIVNPDIRRSFFDVFRKLASLRGVLFLTNQGFGAGGFITQNFAISLGSVALVNALQGVQFVFVIILAVIASVFYPKLAQEGDIDLKIIMEKFFATAIIAAGLWVLATA